MSVSFQRDQTSTRSKSRFEYLYYPRAVYYIVITEFCERFCYYGMKTVLALYIADTLHFDTKNATIIFHIFAGLCYLFPLIGGILSDGYLGKFKTIFYLAVIYLLGNILLSVAAVTQLNLPQTELSMLALFCIAFGTGGIKPCVSSFGGDQFVLPQQEQDLHKYFTTFYFAINAGSLFSTFLTPLLRNDVKCFGEDSCFPVAFGVPAFLMFMAICVFLIGKPLYKINKPEGNIFIKVMGCIGRAIAKKFTTKSSERTKSHWLDYADDKFSLNLISDVKILLGVLLLFIPLPLFWALFDQQGSSWTFQAVRMDGRIPGTSITMKPDQFQILNPLFILALIPVFQSVIYPIIKHLGVNTPLRKMIIGGLLAALAFVFSALVESRLAPILTITPNKLISETSFGIMKSSIPELTPSTSFLAYENYMNTKDSVNQMFETNSRNIRSVNDTAELSKNLIDETLNKDLEIIDKKLNNAENILISLSKDIKKASVQPKQDEKLSTFPIEIERTFKFIDTKEIVRDEENRISMLWLIPQYFTITAGEIMFSITGLEFVFTQAPLSMKAILAAFWSLTTAFGNVVVAIIFESSIFDNQVYQLLLFAGLMFVDMIILMVLAMRYKYVSTDVNEAQAEDVATISMQG